MEQGGRQFPNRLRKFRRIHKLKQSDVKKLLGVSQCKISRWENGKALPDVINLFKLSNLFSTLPTDLYLEVYKKAKPAFKRRALTDKRKIKNS